MINILNYNLNSDYESNKNSLSQLDNYVVLTEDNQMVHLKQQFKGLIINTNSTGTTIYKRTADRQETVTLEYGENKLTDWYYGFYFDANHSMKQNQITSFDLSKYDTSNVTKMRLMFYNCTNLTSLDVSKFNTSKVTDMYYMFTNCSGLTSLDVSNFDTSKVTMMNDMFSGCSSLTHIKCKQAFKDWCITNQDVIGLPTEMRDGGSGQWEIVG